MMIGVSTAMTVSDNDSDCKSKPGLVQFQRYLVRSHRHRIERPTQGTSMRFFCGA